jgi:prevent-host-death family protein
MTDITATEAARKFADLLDAVERGEHFTIVRRGKPVAHLEPAHRGRGVDVKALFARHDIDEQWSDDVEQSRQLLRIEERR